MNYTSIKMYCLVIVSLLFFQQQLSANNYNIVFTWFNIATVNTAPQIGVTDNTCTPDSSGSFDIINDCGPGTHIEWSTDEGATWSTNVPLYTTLITTVVARCVDDGDPNIVSDNSNTVTSNPLSYVQEICEGQAIEAEAEAGHDTYQWYKDGMPIPAADGGNLQMYTITSAGQYNYTINGAVLNGTCLQQMCCPLVVVETVCQPDCMPVVCLPISITKQPVTADTPTTSFCQVNNPMQELPFLQDAFFGDGANCCINHSAYAYTAPDGNEYVMIDSSPNANGFDCPIIDSPPPIYDCAGNIVCEPGFAEYTTCPLNLTDVYDNRVLLYVCP